MSFFEAIDPIFRTYVLRNAPFKQIASGFGWTEGPVWFGDAGCLLFSDILRLFRDSEPRGRPATVGRPVPGACGP